MRPSAASRHPAPPAGDRRAADPYLDEPLDADHLLLRVLPGLQVEAGRRWHERDAPAIEGHRRHAAVERVVADLEMAARTGPVRGDLVVVCPEGERHLLPARMAAEVWRRRGWRVRVLPPSLPGPRLAGHLKGWSGGAPTAVVVSATTPASLPGAVRAVAAAAAVGLPVLAGGAGFGADDRRAALVGATGWAADVAAAEQVLEAWRRSGPPPAPPARPPDDTVGLLELEVAAVHAALRRTALDRAALGLVHHAAEVAAAREVVDDDRVLDEAVRWLALGLAARRLAAARPLAALVEALRPWSPLVADGVAAAADRGGAASGRRQGRLPRP